MCLLVKTLKDDLMLAQTTVYQCSKCGSMDTKYHGDFYTLKVCCVQCKHEKAIVTYYYPAPGTNFQWVDSPQPGIFSF